MQDVLVRIGDPLDFERGSRGAARLAAALRGRLTGLHAVQIGMPPPSLYDPTALAAEWATCAEREVRNAQGHEAAFVAWASSMGARDPAWTVGAGAVPDLVAHVAGWHDVLVLVRAAGDADPWSTPAGIARTVLAVDLPCLVLPPDVELQPPCGTVAVAWNGSAQAIRALHAALPLLEGAGRVVLLTGDVPEASMLRPAFPLQRWLEARLPRVEVCPLDAHRQDGAGILDAVHECGAELLVMGAYGRSRAAEWLLGGVTRHVLQHAALPVLMRH